MSEPATVPTWRYSVSGAARIITTAEELAALEAGQWFASPQEAADAAARAQAAGDAESPAPARSRR